MELVQILNGGNLSQSSQWGEYISINGNRQQGQVLQDVVTLAPVDTQSLNTNPQYYFIDTDGSLLPIILEDDNIAFLAEPNNEIPSWRLDHMYAKKPREPGTEQVKPTKRRSKKKELLTSQFFVQDMVEDSPPKINIIRQRHGVGYSRPKILTSPHKFTNPCSSTNSSYYSSSSSAATTASSSSIYSSFNISKIKVDPESRSSEEFSVPSPGAVVTVSDELDSIVMNSKGGKSSSRKFMYTTTSTGLLPAQLEIRNSSLDSIEEPDDDAELFFDFPMEEEEEATIDVDFNEIPMNTGGTSSSGKEILDSATSFFHHSTNSSTDIETDFVIRGSTPLLSIQPWDSDSSSSAVVPNNNNNETDHQKKNNLHMSVNILGVDKRKRGRPRKNQSSTIDCLRSPKTSSKVKEKQDSTITPTPTRRSTRPVKVPSRLDWE